MTQQTIEFASELMLKAFKCLDNEISHPIHLIVGGGASLILAHEIPLVTHDIDAIPRGTDLTQIDEEIKRVAQQISLPPDWLNPYFGAFTHVLPPDYESRLICVFKGQRLEAHALGKDEMLIMKCFAGRKKDVSHARALIQKGASIEFAEKHIESLLEKKIPGAQNALDFLDECGG
ncbi:MAG: hypothetical protein CL678_01720 [Bdellovibrionaceae bacterium]|nr:hypothetical protein [Pseudobdellovibrionaceae bacterium]|tara:strand:- start:1744 stop:2271 length:528 start_codon:yes stop_codon:yes gene_type:complete